MDINIGLVFGSLNAAEKIASYLGIVETLNGKIEQLKNSYLTSGIRALEQAQTSEYEYNSLLREARSNFNKAIDLEKEEKLITAYIGLGFCHYGLGDKRNCYLALQTIKNIELDDNFLLRRGHDVLSFSTNMIYFPLTGMSVAEAQFQKRKEKVSEVKKSVRDYLNKI